MNNIIEIKNLTKKFGEQVVLDDITLEIDDGKTTAIIGSSGSGKSTLLRILCGLDKQTTGEILGERNGIGFVFQDFNLFPNLSVEKNITLALKKTKDEAKQIAKNMLTLVGLDSAQNKYPCNLSGGMKQRVGIARALALEPKILCLDEPTSALDPELTAEVLRVVKSLNDKGYTLVIVTHEINFAKKIADKVVFIDKGKIAEIGTADIITKPKTKRLQEFLTALAVD